MSSGVRRVAAAGEARKEQIEVLLADGSVKPAATLFDARRLMRENAGSTMRTRIIRSA